MRKGILFFLAIFLGLSSANSGLVIDAHYLSTSNWGFFAHKKINRLAIFALPSPLFDFYRKHIEYITNHAIDPDKRRYAVKGEAECHFLDIDYYTDNAELIDTLLPYKWKEAIAKYSEDTLRKHGIAPYNIQWVMLKLGKAFEECDTEKILKHSADLGHYIADIHVPLHTTKNYNGQFSNQDGIHAFWESRLPELFYDKYELLPQKAVYLDYPPRIIWRTVIESNLLLHKVLLGEDSLSKLYPNGKYAYVERGATMNKDYSEEYATIYHNILDNMVEQRMLKAIEMLSSMWYTAWVNAGQPDLTTAKFSNTEALKEDVDDTTLNEVRSHE